MIFKPATNQICMMAEPTSLDGTTPLSETEEPPELGTDDFTRRFALRTPNLMWFLGAGASASAGIPTAGDMIWEFKQLLYVSQRRVFFRV